MVEHTGQDRVENQAETRQQPVATSAEALDQHTRDVIAIMLDLVREQLDVPVAMLTLGVGPDARVVVASGEVTSDDVDPLLCRLCLDSGGRLVIQETASMHTPLGAQMVAEGVRAYLGLAVVDAAGTPIGVVCAYGDRPRLWSMRDIDTLRGLAAVLDTEFRTIGLCARAA